MTVQGAVPRESPHAWLRLGAALMLMTIGFGLRGVLSAAAFTMLVCMALPVQAQAPQRSPRIESCVSHDALVIGPQDRNTMLDDADRATVFDAMVQRYPLFARDGTRPSQILLWHRGGRDWLFVTLLQKPDDPNQACFTATFTAPVFQDITPDLLRKYFKLPATDGSRA